MAQLPVELQALISAAVIFVVTEGLKNVSNWFGFDLSGFGAGLAAAIVAIIVGALNGFLGQVPQEYVQSVQMALALLVSILGAFGVYEVKQQLRGMR